MNGDKLCKSFPGDPSWPSGKEWAALNMTVGGRLVATVPLGSPCHNPNYNAAECATLQSEWRQPPVHYNSSSSVMAPIFANQSCDPFQPPNGTCTLGNYVVYAVNASGPADIAAAIRFADAKDVRLVIRNTGHDYLGRSTGAGALAVWTHHLKSIEVLDWHDSKYKGKALKIGAGVQGFEAVNAAAAEGLVVLTGECPSVGIAGGYTQGGGHSMLSSAFGLSADNTLEFEAVTADGRLVKASPQSKEHADLYWALSGGGAGNYAVVLSTTIRAHADVTVSGAGYLINGPNTPYPAIVDAFHAALPGLIDSGAMVIYSYTNSSFRILALTAYNRTQGEVEAMLAPFKASLTSLAVAPQPNITQFSSYREHFLHYFGPFPEGIVGVGVNFLGGRLVSRDGLSKMGPVAREMMRLGLLVAGVSLDVSRFGQHNANAVLPQWRDSIVSAILQLPYSFDVPFSDMIAEAEEMTDTVMPIIEKVTPGSGAYMNEADYRDPNWKTNFFGANYDKLLGIKKRYDPKGLFYATAAVNSDAWTIDSNGRMCRA
ncbi:FAD-binding domain-containing protein [Thozetella sp. PMI_491]|nr:FAD-binding domain-containing protein [Thozetella sp. PMI_491]